MNKTQLRGFKALVKKIEKSNAKFAKATPAQKIVMVAQDVVSLLDLERIDATQGIYFEVDTYETGVKNPDSCQLSELLKLPELPNCNVCAIGGAMLATTMRLNRVTKSARWGNLEESYDESATGDDNSMSARANEVFPSDLLRYMEDAFEGGCHGYERLKDPSRRMRAIYQNLVDNKGKCFTRYRSTRQVVYPNPRDTEA